MNKEASVDSCTFVAFDFETTGLYPASDKIIEFGAVRFRAGEILGEFSELANPGIPVHEDAARVSGITTEMLADKKPVSELLPSFMTFLDDAILIAHNAGFDAAFLRAALGEHGAGELHNVIIDTQILAQKAFPKQRSYGLQNLVTMLGIPPNTAHRAYDDAVMCMKVFRSCVDALSFMGDLELGEVLT